MRQSPAVALDAHAVETLRYIRASMDAAATVAVSGSAGIAMGTVGLLAAVAASTASLGSHWLALWLIAAVVALLAGGLLMARQARLQGFTLFGAPVRRFVLCLAPGLFAGAMMTLVHWRGNNLHAIPGTWLLLYGCALISTSAPTTRMVGILGSLFAVLGMVTFWIPDTLHSVALGAGFGGLHFVFGVMLRRSSHGS